MMGKLGVLTRRDFVNLAGGALAAAGLPNRLVASASREHDDFKPVKSVFLDLHRVRKWDESQGDTWDPFWGEDGSLYAFNCDGRGFGQSAMNLAFNRLAGDAVEGLAGSQVNPMGEYGKANQKGADNATWKACGQECIDGVFYAFVSRNTYGSDSKDPLLRQLAQNASLIKSTDQGRTWTRTAQENYDKPMWPGSHFGAPFFVHYGRNGGQVERDRGREYVYACSTNGFWNDGDSLILGRVRRELLPRLDSSDWEYLVAGDGNAPTSWSGRLEHAIPVVARPGKCGQTPITWVPGLGAYLLVSWYNTQTLTKWYEPNEMQYDFYQAPHPWGPWTLVGSHTDAFLGPGYHMYGPSLCARFQMQREEGVEVSLFTSGCPFDDVKSSPYKMWHIPVVLRTEPLPSWRFVDAGDAAIQYSGPWFAWSTQRSQDALRLPQATQSQGSWAELAFTGTGIDYVAEKSLDLGEVDILIDGQESGVESLELADFPVFFGVTAFSHHGLSRGRHTIRIVNRSDRRVNVEGFRVYA